MPQPLKNQDRAYNRIRQKLLTGQYRTTKELSRRRLAAELDVSPGCVQVVLGRLEAERLVETRPQSGTSLRQIDIEEYHQHYDLRELIEPYAARRAAGWITAAQLGLLDQSSAELTAYVADLERMEDTDAVPPEYYARAVRAEYLLHGTIMEAARNPAAAHFIENLHILNFPLPFNWLRSQGALIAAAWQAIAEHRAIMDALTAGDGLAAERCMRRHLRNSRLYIAPIR